MTTESAGVCLPPMREFSAGTRRLPATVPGEFPVPHPATGTNDDDYDRSDEHRGENEASEGAVDELTEAPEEFEIDDEHEADRPHGSLDNDQDDDDDAGEGFDEDGRGEMDAAAD